MFYFSLLTSPKTDLWITFGLNNRLRSIIAFEMTRNFSRDYFSSVNFPSQMCNMRSSSFRCVLKCRCFVLNEFGFFAIFFRRKSPLVLHEVMSLHSTIKIMKQRPGFLACLCKDTAPTRYWLKLLCFPQHLNYRADSAIFPQDILWICRENISISIGDETFASLSDGFELHGDGKTEEIVLT